MRNYFQIVKEQGLYAAVQRFEADMILEFISLSKAETARRLKIQRTTLIWKIEKLNLGRFFKGDQIKGKE